MAPDIFNDGSSGTVVIRSGPPASGGGGDGFGGNRVGASGAFGGVSQRTRNARKRAKQQYLAEQARKDAQAAADAAHAQQLARILSRQQLLMSWTPRYDGFRAAVEQRYAARAAQLEALLQQDISAARRPPVAEPTERWQLYLITKDKAEVDGLIARKASELNAMSTQAHSFDGHDALSRSTSDYLARLDQFGDALAQGHQVWENAYSAAYEAKLLSEQIHVLTEKSNALTRLHAEQTIVWRDRVAAWEGQRQVAEQRDARIVFKQQADADRRLERVRQANTLTLSSGVVAAGGAVWTPAGAVVAQELSAILERAAHVVAGAVVEAGAIAARTAPVFVTAMVYSPRLGNGELTAEQRNRMSTVIAVPAHALGLYDSQELHTIADQQGVVEAQYRVNSVPVSEGTAINVISTGGEIDPRVPVVNAALDPLTGLYGAEIPGSPARHVQFAPDVASSTIEASGIRTAVMEPKVLEAPAGVDLRIQDCIVCLPGMEPIYLSFNVPTMGSGVVIGTGQPAAADWWQATNQETGAAIPAAIAVQLLGREFKSLEAFDHAVWREIAEHERLNGQFEELNKKRIAQGYAPYAPKSAWSNESREFELRYQEREQFWSEPFNLDKVSIKAPTVAEGWIGILPAVVAWPIDPVINWRPLAPPGSEHLGSTTSPISPTDPLVYPGSSTVPVSPQLGTFPAIDPGQSGATIPGFPGDMELPSSDALFRDRRDDPGVATGNGQVVSGIWLGEAARGNGAPVPVQIADQLRGREFANFHRFREAFWKAVAADEFVRHQFSDHNLHRMRKGLSPYPTLSDQGGGRKTYELHHDAEVAKGGEVYGIDNILVVTPTRHIQLHKDRNYDL